MGIDLSEVELFQKSMFFEKRELQITYPGKFNDGSAYYIEVGALSQIWFH